MGGDVRALARQPSKSTRVEQEDKMGIDELGEPQSEENWRAERDDWHNDHGEEHRLKVEDG